MAHDQVAPDPGGSTQGRAARGRADRPVMSSLEYWTHGSHTAGGVTHPTYRKGSGPGVIVIHEIPGITPAVLEFAEDVVARGFSVVMPSLFGRPGAEATVLETLRSIAGVCVSREFTMFALGRTTPVATWLQTLSRALHRELGGPGVGAVGMCLTGGYALAMLAGAPVAAPVVAQPASPAPVGKARRADLGLSPGDLKSVKAKVAAVARFSDSATRTTQPSAPASTPCAVNSATTSSRWSSPGVSTPRSPSTANRPASIGSSPSSTRSSRRPRNANGRSPLAAHPERGQAAR